MTPPYFEYLNFRNKFVTIAISDYPERQIPLPLFAISVGLVSTITSIYPWLGIFTIPAAILLVLGVFTGDVNYVDKSNLEEE